MRILGICHDGPSETQRIVFDNLPELNDDVEIEIFSGSHEARPTYAYSGGGTWRRKWSVIYTYTVVSIESDAFGHKVTLHHSPGLDLVRSKK